MRAQEKNELSVCAQTKNARIVLQTKDKEGLFGHSKTDKGVEFVCAGWTATSQQKLVMVWNESEEACAKPKKRKRRQSDKNACASMKCDCSLVSG